MLGKVPLLEMSCMYGSYKIWALMFLNEEYWRIVLHKGGKLHPYLFLVNCQLIPELRVIADKEV